MPKPGWLLAVLLVALTPATHAQPAPDATLYLRVETGLHEADINQITLLPGDAGLISVSDDKTARIWSLDTLEARAVLRPPIGPLDDGALYAVAASGPRIALAGRVRDRADRFAISFFALSDLHPLGAINGLPQPVIALRFSPSGDVLAAGLIDGEIDEFDLKSATERQLDPAHRAAISGMTFDPQGRLVVAAEDGSIRLFAPDGQLMTRKSLRAGARPYGVSVSPDGRLLAVGDRNRATVRLLDAATLEERKELKGVPQRLGGLDVVAFSPDGTSLFAAGTYKDVLGRRFVLRWTGGAGVPTETAVAADSVTGLLPLDDALLFSTAEPAIGRLDRSGHVVAEVRSRHIDFRNADLVSFRVSADGSMIELPTGPPRADAAGHIIPAPNFVFDLVGRQVLPPSAVTMKLAPFYGSAGRLAVTEWQNQHAPRINGRLIALEPDEITRSIAASPDGSGAAIGTDFYIRYESRERELWHAVTAAPAWAVNISGDGRLVVAGLGDGTIHWYRASDGTELLALFIDPTTQRFVLWTPDGFFDHDHRDNGSPDGRTLIGYRFNTAAHRVSDFVQIGQLYGQFFRPDLVGLAFADQPAGRQLIAEQRERLGSVAQVLARGLPAVASILDACGEVTTATGACPASRPLDASNPADHPGAQLKTAADTLLLRFQLVNPGGKPGQAIVQRNDAVIAPTLNTVQETDHSQVLDAAIPLGEGLNTIRITPLSDSGAVEATGKAVAELKVFRAPPPPPPATDTAAVPNQPAAPAPAQPPGVTLYVLSVGISHFGHPEMDLGNAANDARAVLQIMQGPDAPVYDRMVPKLLVDGDATRANIEAALDDIAAHAGPDDMVLIFFAGHGENIDGNYYFAPADFGMQDPDSFKRAVSGEQDVTTAERTLDDLFRHDGLDQRQLLTVIHTIRAAHVAVILDTCYSASLATQDAVLRRDINTTVSATLGHATGRFVLSSSFTLAQDSAAIAGGPTEAKEAGNHGLFTYYLLRALRGDADSDHTGRIDIYKLAKYTKREVTKATEGSQAPQVPEFYFAGNEFFDLRALGTQP